MRILDKTEQDLCVRILQGNGKHNYIGNIIDNKLNGVCISIIRSTKKVEIEITTEERVTFNEDASAVIAKINSISVEILTAINLIKMLEKDGYIMLLRKAMILPDSTKFGGCISNSPGVIYHFADENISELLIEYVSKEIVVTESFRDFCNHNFITREEQRFRQTMNRSTIALFLAVFAFLAAAGNFGFNLWTNTSNKTQIKQEQIDILNSEIKVLQNKLDTINITSKYETQLLIDNQQRIADSFLKRGIKSHKKQTK